MDWSAVADIGGLQSVGPLDKVLIETIASSDETILPAIDETQSNAFLDGLRTVDNWIWLYRCSGSKRALVAAKT